MRFSSDQMYFKSPQEMAELFRDIPEALENTLRIAERCNVFIGFDRFHMPTYPLPQGYSSPDHYLEALAREGLSSRYSEITPEIEQRLNYELKIIREMGYSGYFLIVADFVRFARENNIPCGGRGSAIASLVAYALGITNVDPIKYGLIFERLLNPERVSMPDIDVDIADRRRDEVIRYVKDKYGSDNVCQIITFGTMAARAVVRDVGRVLGMPYSEVDRIAKLIPPDLGMTLERAIGMVPELKEIAESGGVESELISYAKTLEGLTRHASVHAAGIVITPDELTNYVPLFKTNKNEITTQYDWKCIEEIGLVKMDLLGLRTFTVIDDTVSMLRQRGIDIDLNSIPLDDPDTYKIFSRGETIGVFQFSGSGMTEYVMRLKPSSLEDLIAMTALYRPGPLGSGMVEDFILRKHGLKEIEYPHPLLEPILKETYGVIVYQEQVMRIARDLAGYTLGGADLLRRAMGKKDPEIMADQRKHFLEGAKAKGIDPKVAEEIFELMEYFAGYGFNKSHSAGYALIAYQTAYLKAHYPKEFMAANLTSEMGNSDKIVELIEDCQRMGIRILPPDVNESLASFTVVEDGIRFGLGAVKNVGLNAIESIVRAREKWGPFKTIYDFCERVDLRAVNRKAIESLIMAGAMDSLEGHRAQLMAALDKAIDYGQSSRARQSQMSLLDMVDGKGGFSLTPPLPDVPEWPEGEKLAKEKEMLGFYVSGHPLEKYEHDLRAFTAQDIEALAESGNGSEVRIGGIIVAVKRATDRNGKQMAFVSVEDFRGVTEVLVFSDAYERYKNLINIDSMVMVRGKLSSKGGEVAKVIADEIFPLSEAREQYASSININLVSADLDENTINDIKEVLERYRGKFSVVFHVDTSYYGKIAIRSKSHTVSLSDELMDELKKLVGPGNIWIE